MVNYIENVSFFISHEIVISNKFQANKVFQNENDQVYISVLEDESLKKNIINNLLDGRIDSEKIEIQDIKLTLSVFGICNLRIMCIQSDEIDPDSFSFDEKYEDIYILIEKFLCSNHLIKKENPLKSLFDKVEPSYKYLYHQHIIDQTRKGKNNPDTEWSVYYHTNDHISDVVLDLDSFLLECHVLHYVFSRCYIKLLDSHKDIDLKTIQLLLNKNRKSLAEHKLMLNELDTKNFEMFINLHKVHKIDQTSNIYDRLENNIEHLSKQMEDERRHKESKIMEIIFLGLALLGLISIATGILALISGRKDIANSLDQNSTIWTPVYKTVLDYPENYIIGASLFLFFLGLLYVFYRLFRTIIGK